MPCRSPATLKVNKNSHSAKKRPVQVRQPVIIYVESPKVVHVSPSEFRSVVQRLTGAAPSASAPSPSTMFSASAPQFPFQLYGLAQEALNDSERRTLPFVASTLSPTIAAAPVSGSLFASSSPGDAGQGAVSLFSNHQLSPAFLFDHQNMVPGAGPSSVQANLLVSSAPLLLPSIGACHGDLFINQ
ncbi:uncharacterized protein LOC133887800 [Phragmites australis]|uniref:uncharacterized protein LOC133887800 n=1 Tax=Phragmites australis TaxID=29695 RepID=UPI002D77A970|nr:uncharacterized protein LOC133887800 [Phragmites australis]